MTAFDSLSSLPLSRRWREQTYPVASVLALIRHESGTEAGAPPATSLLIRRTTEPYLGKWGLVGGRWEFGETLEAAITREVREETGLDTTFVALRGLVNERITPRGPDDDGAHYLLFVCEVYAPTGTACEQSEGPVAWFSRDEMEGLDKNREIISTDYAIVQRFTWEKAEIPYIEAEVVASSGEKGSDELLGFGPGPQQ
jgi:ADP-ribose pyrophosphatase YjhB (NUDIX family)